LLFALLRLGVTASIIKIRNFKAFVALNCFYSKSWNKMVKDEILKIRGKSEGKNERPRSDSILSEEEELEALELAKFYIISGKYDEAERLLHDVLKKNPGNIEALYHLGLLYELTNRLDEAIKKFQNVLQLNPSHKEAEEHLHKLMEI